MTRRPSALVAAAALALVTAVAPAAVTAAPAAASATERLVIDDGHVDIGPRLVDGTWRFQLRDDTVSPPVWRELGSVALRVGDAAVIEVPEGDVYGFLGDPGAQVWVLPQAQRAGIVWPGWNTQDPTVVSGVTGDVTWTLESIAGPGTFWLFLTDSFGAPSLVFDGSRPWPQDTDLVPNTHVHGNWAFSEPGVYRMRTSMSATGTDGAALSDTAELVLAVGDDADLSQIPPPASAGGTTPDGTATTGRSTAGAGEADGGGVGALPNTGAGYLVPLVAVAAAVLAAAVGLGAVARRRSRGAAGRT